MIKKIIKNTVGVALGGVGIHQANQIDEPGGEAIGIAMAGGLAMEVAPKKKKGGMF